jgi:DnaA-homolog protein
MTQLTLSLVTPPRFTFENLVVHEGIERAISTIRRVYTPSARPLPPLFLYGSPGTGKTHILSALTAMLGKSALKQPGWVTIIDAEDEPPNFPQLARLIALDEAEFLRLTAVAVDDVHRISGEDRAHFWNLCNKLNRSGAALLMASRVSPEETFRDDPHLSSRIASGLVFCLEPPADPVRVLILDKMARDRNLRVSPDVGTYLVTRKSRNVKELGHLMEILDRASLRLKRRITLPLIKDLEREGAL